MKITEFMRDHLLLLDGGMGTLLQAAGLRPGEAPERWNLDPLHSSLVCDIHRQYYEAGSNLVNTNTFGANRLHFGNGELEAVVAAGLALARKAREEAAGNQPKFIALDLGPTGKLLKPYGDLSFDDAVSIFAQVVQLGVKHGADCIFIETMNDSLETKAALLAAKENSDLPVFVSNAYGADGKLMTGASPAAMVAMLEGMGADAIGLNCSLGPQALLPAVREYLAHASIPVLFKPNAGLPTEIDGKAVYTLQPEDFAAQVAEAVRLGVRAAGGCCGTTPAYIEALAEAVRDLPLLPVQEKKETVISSYTHAVTFGASPVLIGERINPTGKKRFKEALRTHDLDYILGEGLRQQENGAQVLDVNVGLPEIDEPALLCEVMQELQAVSDLPLQIDTSDPVAMARALRYYNGCPLINSVNGKAESMTAIFPLMQKYGGVAIALTLDETGIPETAEGRVAIAEKIIAAAKAAGIPRHRLIFDPLAMAVSADPTAAETALEAVRRLHAMGCLTSMGVSNISFGLPARDAINGVFFACALERGLSAAIMNPDSAEMMKTYHAFRALHGMDAQFGAYIDFAARLQPAQTAQAAAAPAPSAAESGTALQEAICKGLREQAAALTKALLETQAPLEIVNNEIIPALDRVGVGYEKKQLYLPQLLMSAEAAKFAFEVIKAAVPAGSRGGKCAVVIATVRGDIHDIGKNIVKLLLENYGFAVTDLGKDVTPEAIRDAVIAQHAPLAALSALMTTTVPAMAETVQLLHAEAPWCKVMVGGAVLTQAYADRIGADFYSPDAMGAVRFAEQINAATAQRRD
ncbi:MAG: homocysteine S-methyltransferase family protein [Clostridia bacterium]|nr:homocysteine S-methyltransferase family protein [Clostridia bacterium]